MAWFQDELQRNYDTYIHTVAHFGKNDTDTFYLVTPETFRQEPSEQYFTTKNMVSYIFG